MSVLNRSVGQFTQTQYRMLRKIEQLAAAGGSATGLFSQASEAFSPAQRQSLRGGMRGLDQATEQWTQPQMFHLRQLEQLF